MASASSSVDSLDPSSGSSAEALDEQPPQHHVAGGAGRQRADEAAGRLVELATSEQGGDARMFLQRAERVESVRQHGQIAHRGQPGGQALQRRRGVDADRPADADEVDQLVGDPSLGPRVLLRPGGELLRTDGDGAAAHTVGDALVDEHVEVAADRHLADVELAGELHDADAAVDVEAPADQPEPVHAVEVHSSTGLSSRVRLTQRAPGLGNRAEHAEGEALGHRVAERRRLDRADRDGTIDVLGEELQQERRPRSAAEHLDARQAELGERLPRSTGPSTRRRSG